MLGIKVGFFNLLKIGVAEAPVLGGQYRQRSITIFCLIVIAITSVFYSLFIVSKLWIPLLVLILDHFLFACALYFNYLRQYKIANHMLFLSSNTCVFLMSYYFGFDAGFHLYLYSVLLVGFWVCELCIKRDIIIAVSISFMYYVFMYWFKVHGVKDFSVHTFLGVEIYNINVTVNFIIIFFLFYNYSEYFKSLTQSILIKEEHLLEDVYSHISSEEHIKNELEDLKKKYKNLEQFSLIVSHNLHSPLSNVKAFLSLYEPQEDPSDNDIVIQNVKESTGHLDMILTDLNVILDSKKQASEAKSIVYLKDVMDEVKISLSDEIHKNIVIINQDFDPKIKLNTIKTVLNSILFNLIQNAIKYRSEYRVPEITVTASQLGKQIQIRIEDNGIGIDLNRYKDRIFKLYNRFSTAQEGKGIGLYLVKSNVEMLGGSIMLESQINVGCTFIITI